MPAPSHCTTLNQTVSLVSVSESPPTELQEPSEVGCTPISDGISFTLGGWDNVIAPQGVHIAYSSRQKFQDPSFESFAGRSVSQLLQGNMDLD